MCQQCPGLAAMNNYNKSQAIPRKQVKGRIVNMMKKTKTTKLKCKSKADSNYCDAKRKQTCHCCPVYRTQSQNLQLTQRPSDAITIYRASYDMPVIMNTKSLVVPCYGFLKPKKDLWLQKKYKNGQLLTCRQKNPVPARKSIMPRDSLMYHGIFKNTPMWQGKTNRNIIIKPSQLRQKLLTDGCFPACQKRVLC